MFAGNFKTYKKIGIDLKKIIGIVILLSTLVFGEVEYDYEFDAYYTNVSAFIDIDSESNVTDATHMSEVEIYERLLYNTFSPNIFLIEAAVHPMGLGGLFFRQNNKEYYDRSKLQGFNWVKALTIGFEEPYSISFFLGRMMVFKNEKSDHTGKNRAYMGYLLTIGDYSIKDNLIHYDRWSNVEFKLKGTRELTKTDLDWSFRVGVRMHENKNFVNSVYFGARRSSIDYDKKILSFIYNSDFNTMIAASTDTFQLTEASFSVGKKYPVYWPSKMSFGLEVGYMYYSGEKYRGALKEEGIDNHQIILRPNFKW